MFTLYAAMMAAHAQGIRYEALISGPAFPTPVTMPLLAVEAEVATVSFLGGGSGQGDGRPEARPIVLRRTPDPFSASFPSALTGVGGYDVRIRALGNHPQEGSDLVLFELHLTGAAFSGLRAQLSTEGAPIETIDLIPGCLEATSSSYDPQGALIRSTSYAWSFELNEAGCTP